MKVVINKCWGGFGLSAKAEKLFLSRTRVEFSYDTPRNNPELVNIVEELGEGANGHYAELKIVEIPDDIKWSISEYDGMESVEEEHQSWS